MPAVDDTINSGPPPYEWGRTTPTDSHIMLYHNGTTQASVTGINARRIDSLNGTPTIADWDNAKDFGEVISEGTNEGTTTDPATGDPHYAFRGAVSHPQIVRVDPLLYAYVIAGNSVDSGSFDDARNRRCFRARSLDNGRSWDLNLTPLALTYNLPSSTGEAGCFSACPIMDPATDELLLYYGAMNETSPGQVNTEIRLAVLEDDGITVKAGSDVQVFAFNEGGLVGSGDEIWPCSMFIKSSGRYCMYYMSNGFPINYIESDARDFSTDRSNNAQLLGDSNYSAHVFGEDGANIILNVMKRPSRSIDVYNPPAATPDVLGSVVDSGVMGFTYERIGGVR